MMRINPNIQFSDILGSRNNITMIVENMIKNWIRSQRTY